MVYIWIWTLSAGATDLDPSWAEVQLILILSVQYQYLWCAFYSSFEIFCPSLSYSTGVVSGVSIHLIAYFLLRTCIWVFISFIFIVTIRKLFLRNTCRLVFLVIRCCEWILFEPAKIDIFFLLWSAKIDMFFAYAQNNDQLETPAYYHKETWQGGGGEEPKG